MADFIIQKLHQAGADHVFLITGGMIMYLTDALLQYKKLPYICCHHEQAATMAAEAYGRFTGKLGVALVTAGPAALNAITGVVGAYLDSSPCIIVAGQSKVALAKVKGIRQFPLQGFDSLPLFKHITKYAVMLDKLSRVRYEVEKCIYLAQTHRVGPVYLECPIDIQGAYFDPDEFEGFRPPAMPSTRSRSLAYQIRLVKDALSKSKKPCILAGAGIRLSGAIEVFHQFIEKTGIPVITSRLGMDLIDHEHPLFVGRPGTYGDRAANFTVQNADLLISIGCRLGIGLVGYDYKNFAPHAKKIVVDIDEQELLKPSVIPDIAIKTDARLFLTLLGQVLGKYHLTNIAWRQKTQSWKKMYPVDLPQYLNEKKGINSYHFIRLFSEKMARNAVFVLDTGSCFHVYAQAFKVKFGQRHIVTGGLSTMGYMPASIGVASANKGREVYCITGDGSIQMNLQELQTIIHNKLPVKIIIFNNNGYLLIRHTQKNFCEGRFIGESPATGVSFPDMRKIARAYGFPYLAISKNHELIKKLEKLKKMKGPLICEVMTPADQPLIPRVSSKKDNNGRFISMPYDDMYPFLPREEYLRNCLCDDCGCENGASR
ncbi:MAG: thiamine pyrophosphate-binding protein [Candidatus Omnitrophica bacterium]|nr:thiamine pyrophosphate-binding protein [Candidatus Omnitrophota bacterium]